MENIFSKQAGELGNMQTRIWKRIKRHGDLKGAMPMGMGQLSAEVLSDIKEYLESFDKRDYVRQINTGSKRNIIKLVNEPKF